MENYSESWQQKAIQNGWMPPEEPKKESDGSGFRNFVILIAVVIILAVYVQNNKNKPDKQLTAKPTETTAAAYTVLPGSAAEAVQKDELEMADIKHRADAIGWSTAAWQEWYYIANQTGTTMEAVEGAAKHINTQLEVRDPEFLSSLKELGITEVEAKAMKPEELFEAVINGLRAIED